MKYSLKGRIAAIRRKMPSDDVIDYTFLSGGGEAFALVYADTIADKTAVGELIVKPLRELKEKCADVEALIACPQVKPCPDYDEAAKLIAGGCAIVICEGKEEMFAADVKSPPQRAVMEPPTQVAVKGPREGFTEDVKTNIGLIRKRIKSPTLEIKTVMAGKRTDTVVAVCYLSDVVREGLAEKIIGQIESKEIDIVPDSSYISGFISKRPKSLFKRNATCEKPDVFCAKVCEGRVGIIVDGSPIALTVPYALAEDFQTSEDYYIVSYRATFLRFLRVLALVIGILLPSMYVCAQLFKIQLIPKKLLFKIASSVEGIPLSPSVEMLLTLIVLEVLNEASIRMPKYVGMALSVVGALVLGDTAVKAGIISTPAVIIVAFSAICLYTVPDMVETSTVLRLLYLIVAGSLGIFGLVVLTAGIIVYLAGEQDYGMSLLSPYTPLSLKEMADGVYKSAAYPTMTRPRALKVKNKVRFKDVGNK